MRMNETMQENKTDEELDESCVELTRSQFETLELLSTIFEGIIFATKGVV